MYDRILMSLFGLLALALASSAAHAILTPATETGPPAYDTLDVSPTVAVVPSSIDLLKTADRVPGASYEAGASRGTEDIAATSYDGGAVGLYDIAGIEPG